MISVPTLDISANDGKISEIGKIGQSVVTPSSHSNGMGTCFIGKARCIIKRSLLTVESVYERYVQENLLSSLIASCRRAAFG